MPTLRVQPDPTQLPGDGITATQIQTGPNQGYWYVQNATYNMKRVGNVSPGILPSSARTHQLPANTPNRCRQALGFGPHDPVFANFNRYNDKCKSINMTVWVDAVYGHEGFGYGGGQGHESLARTAAAEPQNDPYMAVETLVYADQIALENEADRRVTIIAEDITSRAADGPNGPSGNYPGGPVWYWDASLTFRLYIIDPF